MSLLPSAQYGEDLQLREAQLFLAQQRPLILETRQQIAAVKVQGTVEIRVGSSGEMVGGEERSCHLVELFCIHPQRGIGLDVDSIGGSLHDQAKCFSSAEEV